MPKTPPRVLTHADYVAVVGCVMDAQVLHQRALATPERDQRAFLLGRSGERLKGAQLVLRKARPMREAIA